MKDEKIVKLTISALLHDIGKIIYRQGADTRKHSISGYYFLKEQIGLNDRDITDGILYHHYEAISAADIDADSIAYIVYIADNIASASDRRPSEDYESGFDVNTPLQPVFNLLNRNKKSEWYLPFFLNENAGINYPTLEKKAFQKSDYDRIVKELTNELNGIEWDYSYVESLLEVLETNLSYVPSATSKQEIPDISLYDHLKMTAAFAGCIYKYLQDKGITDYKNELLSNSDTFYEKELFLLTSFDLSGIQDFIYTIASADALKTLRARSFYLEIMMEHIIDTLFERVGLCRTNLIYAGGGHCYLLLPNTEETIDVVNRFATELNQWFLDTFGTGLYAAWGYAQCSTMSLKNKPTGSYAGIFKKVSSMISEKKLHRYDAEDIIRLNSLGVDDYSRECRICHRLDKTDEDDLCNICRLMKTLSGKVLYSDFFAVSSLDQSGIPLPFDRKLLAGDRAFIRDIQDKDKEIKIYGKNKRYTGKNLSSKLWVGNYTTGETFEQLADQAEGIKRIGVLRADVDNLGTAFVAGFSDPENDDRYVTLSRVATLSRQLSLFFKFFINDILNNPQRRIFSTDNKEPSKAAIVYSGGDDVFIVGAWNDILEIALDLERRFDKYTEGSLSLSAGIGIYMPSYPVYVMADEVGRMEDKAKGYPGKKAVTLFDGSTFDWETFEKRVVGEKYRIIAGFFDHNDSRGKNFLYNMLELIRNQTDRINFARFVYLMSRMEPGVNAEPAEKEAYMDFSRSMIKWIQTEEDRRQLESAIIMYVYHIRETEEV